MTGKRGIHPTALVSPDAELADGVWIGPYAVIESKVRIGEGTRIEAFVHINDYVSIGRNCHIFEYTAVGGIPQDHGFRGEITSVRIGDDVILRENVTVNRATGEGNVTEIGDGTMIMDACHLAHNVKIGRHCTFTNKVGFAGHCEVGDYVVIGGMTGFHQFVKVGSYAMVGGMAKIIKDVPPYSMVDGHPARVYGLNTIGLRRNGFTQEQRTHIKSVYRLLYDRTLSRGEALEEIERRWPDDEHAKAIVSFVRSLKRGLTPWMGKGTKAGMGEGEGEAV